MCSTTKQRRLFTAVNTTGRRDRRQRERTWALLIQCLRVGRLCYFTAGILVTLLANVANTSAAQPTEQRLQNGALQGIPVPSKSSDAKTREFDTNYLYVNREIVVERKPDLPTDRHELLLYLTGTGGHFQDAKEFCRLAANLGYHVVNLAYSDDVPATVCALDPNPRAFENYRMAIIQGGSTVVTTPSQQTKQFTFAKADSIESRLASLLDTLKRIRSRENWDQFLNPDGNVKWQTIAVCGQSQGGGHAALIGIKHRVARVICFGAPKDYSKRLKGPADWYADKSATPKAGFFAFNHYQDPKGCTPAELLENLRALGLYAYGPPVDAATAEFPYNHTRILMTSYPQVTVTDQASAGAQQAHGAAISDRNAERWKQAWTYLLTEKAP